jgi:VWFA-related protein
MNSLIPSRHGSTRDQNNHNHNHRTWNMCAGTLLFAVALTTAVCAQSVQSPPPQPPPQQSQAPVQQSTHPPLRVVRQMIQVDVVAKDRDGKPVAGLKQSDFKIYDEGKLEQIAWFSMETKESRTQEAQLRELPPNTYTNMIEQKAGVAGNVTIILLDYENTRQQDVIFARNQLVKLLQQMQPNDRVALYALAGRLYVLHDFTSDMASLLRAIDTYWTSDSVDASYESRRPTFGAAVGDSAMDDFINLSYQRFSDFAAINRVESTTIAFEGIAEHVMRIPGRKNLIWISSAFPISIGLDKEGNNSGSSAYQADASPVGLLPSAYALSPSSGRGGGTGAEGLYIQENRLFSQEVDRAVRALGSANIAIYPVDARGLIGAWGDSDLASRDSHPTGPTTFQAQGYRSELFAQSFDTMNNLAQRTGGTAYYNTNDIGGSISKAMDDARVSYMIAYYPDHDDWHGKFHRLRVTTTRPGVSLHYRSGYFAQPPDYVENLKTAQVWRTAMSSPLDATGVGVSVHVEPKVALEARTMVMEVVVNEGDVSFSHEGDRTTGRLEVVLAQYDKEGTPVASETSEVKMDLTKDTYQKARKEGLHFGRILPISAKAAEVRVFVRDTKSNAIGSVSLPVNLVFKPKTN